MGYFLSYLCTGIFSQKYIAKLKVSQFYGEPFLQNYFHNFRLFSQSVLQQKFFFEPYLLQRRGIKNFTIFVFDREYFFVRMAGKNIPYLLPVPEFIDQVFTKRSPKRSFSVIQNERFGLVFANTGSIISATVVVKESLECTRK
jgi:hypothetical protein